jgi:hypothetical protein
MPSVLGAHPSHEVPALRIVRVQLVQPLARGGDDDRDRAAPLLVGIVAAVGDARRVVVIDRQRRTTWTEGELPGALTGMVVGVRSRT